MNKEIGVAAIMFVSACNDPKVQNHPKPSESPVAAVSVNSKEAAILEKERLQLELALKNDAKQHEAYKKSRHLCKFEASDLPEQYGRIKIMDRLAYVNTHAISCRWKNELCVELEKLGIQPHLLKDSSELFSSNLGHLNSPESFSGRIVEKLQPESDFSELSYGVRLENATQILARSSLGVYQIVPRYWMKDSEKQNSGEEVRNTIYNFLVSKQEQDRLVNGVIENLGKRFDWNSMVMAAYYYSGRKLAEALQEKQKGNDEHDALLFSRRYHGYPSVMSYLEGFDEMMRKYAENEDCDYDDLGHEARVRFFRYAIAKKESSFNMQAFEHSLLEN